MKPTQLLLLGIFLLATWTAGAQEISIDSGSATGCTGFLVDDGLSASDYSTNQNYSFTICAQAPETVINLYWNLFALGNGDSMTIYEGPDNTGPLLGVYTGGDLDNANTYSETGCLTLEFVSDGSDVGNFTAAISCGLPCEPPLAEIVAIETPLKVCVGEEISLDGSPSQAAEGFNIVSYNWDTGYGNFVESEGPVLTHSYEYPGAYMVQLYVTDDNDCTNFNLIDVLVLVSTEPDITLTVSDDKMCPGGEIDISASVLPSTWGDTPSDSLGAALFIPDDQTTCFTSEITFTNYVPGGTIETLDDLENFYINFEHSFMGDLTITFICPNGQNLSVHQQGGGGTFLGVPIDNDFDLTPGVGFDYYWAPDATNGTWEEEGTFITTLPSGTYSSVEPFEQLIGCPINGTWSIEVCDSWGSDNGFIFAWFVNIDTTLLAEPIIFTPEYNINCTDLSWTGDGITTTEPDCSGITLSPTDPGTYVYTFEATDDFGCTYSGDAEIIVAPDPIVEISSQGSLCADEVSLLATVTNPSNVISPYTYSWSPPALLANPNAASTMTNGLSETTTFSVTVGTDQATGCEGSDEFTVVVEDFPPLELFSNDAVSNCPGDEITLTASADGGYPDYLFEWSTGDDSNEITVAPLETTTYLVTVTDNCQDEVTNEVTVSVNPPGTVISADSLQICAGQLSVPLDPSGGTGNYTFTVPDGLVLNDELQVISMIPLGTEIPYTILVEDDCIASGAIDVFVIPCDVTIPNIISPNNSGENDAFVIEGLEYLPNSQLVIFNRWGNKVYETSNYKNDWEPNDLSEGVYFYILTLPTGDEFNGTITLVR